MLWTLTDWARAIVAMPTTPLPSRTVVVPRLRVAHALKRELVRLDPKSLVGTQFVTPALAAREVLALAGKLPTASEEALRPVRVQQRFSGGWTPNHFNLDVLNQTRGWAEALSRTLGELEAAGLSADELSSQREPALKDLGSLWAQVNAEAGDSLTMNAALARAASVLRGGGRWPWAGATLVVVSGHETGAQAAFLNSVPRVSFALLGQRPVRAIWRDRVRALFPQLEVTSEAPTASANELGLLQRFLFAEPEVLSDSRRDRSTGPDGSVELEAFAGVEAELEGAADWVVEQVRRKTPLDRIAVLTPNAEPLAPLVRTRLERIPGVEVFLAGGEPSTHSGTGTRLLALFRALARSLPAEDLCDLLPSMSLDDEGRMSRATAIDVVAELGTPGGSAARREGALEWLAGAEAAQRRLTGLIAELTAGSPGDDESSEHRQLRQYQRQLEAITRLLPALRALHELALAVHTGLALSDLWPRFEAFIVRERRLRLPTASLPVAYALNEAMKEAAADVRLSSLRGYDALDFIRGSLLRLRRAAGRFGEPRVYVGSVEGAVGLGFDAVRVIGLAEGSIPPNVREDAVLPQKTREAMKQPALMTPELRSLSMVQALVRVVLETRRNAAFSYPRASLTGSQHEPSSVFIELAAALGRPHPTTGAKANVVPRTADLERDAFGPAHVARRQRRLDGPVTEAGWLDRTAQLRRDRPSSWSQTLTANPLSVNQVLHDERGGLDGYFDDPGLVSPPGLRAERPLSASRLKVLLECPHRFLLESLVGWSEAQELEVGGSIDSLTYGTLVHGVLERFACEVGSLRSLAREDAHRRLRAIALEQFNTLLSQYSLLGEQVRVVEQRRLFRDLDEFFAEEWNARMRRQFVDAERSFGPLELEGLVVHGYIDRLDRDGSTTLVRDYKTGKPHHRKVGDRADIAQDTQIALYGLVAQTQAAEWGLPAKVNVAYAYANADRPFREFRDEEADSLFSTARTWLAAAKQVLESGTYVRRPDGKACNYCPFKQVCGTEGPARAAEVLAEPQGDAELALAGIWADPEEEEA